MEVLSGILWKAACDGARLDWQCLVRLGLQPAPACDLRLKTQWVQAHLARLATVCNVFKLAADHAVESYAGELHLTAETRRSLFSSLAVQRWAGSFRQLSITLEAPTLVAPDLHDFLARHCSSLHQVSLASTVVDSVSHDLAELAVAASSAKRCSFIGFLPTHLPRHLGDVAIIADLDGPSPCALERLMLRLLVCPDMASAHLNLRSSNQILLRAAQLTNCPPLRFKLSLVFRAGPSADLDLSWLSGHRTLRLFVSVETTAAAVDRLVSALAPVLQSQDMLGLQVTGILSPEQQQLSAGWVQRPLSWYSPVSTSRICQRHPTSISALRLQGRRSCALPSTGLQSCALQA